MIPMCLPCFDGNTKKGLILVKPGTKTFQYCTGPSGRVTYNFHSSCKHIHLSFKSVCNKEHKGAICNDFLEQFFPKHSSYRTSAFEELLVLSRFHSKLCGDKWNLCSLVKLKLVFNVCISAMAPVALPCCYLCDGTFSEEFLHGLCGNQSWNINGR